MPLAHNEVVAAHNEVVEGYINFTQSIRLSISPTCRSTLCLVACFMAYIHMCHKYNPWGDDLCHMYHIQVNRSIMVTQVFHIFVVGPGVS